MLKNNFEDSKEFIFRISESQLQNWGKLKSIFKPLQKFYYGTKSQKYHYFMTKKITHLQANPVVIPRQDYYYRNTPLVMGAIMLTISWFLALPLVLLDLYTMFYHWSYFGYFDFPKVKRADFVRFDRLNLSKLTVFQKINCLYCEYANGVIAYIKTVINCTEIYSCAIKYQYPRPGTEHHTNHFYDFQELK